MKIQFNDYTMNKVFLYSNGITIIEHFERFLVAKEWKGAYKVFFNTASFEQALAYASKM